MNHYKNIMWRDDKNFKGFVVRVMWKNKKLCKYIPYHAMKAANLNPLKFALLIRNAMERDLEKPRTERKISSSIYVKGITQAWKARTRDGRKKTRCYIITAQPNKGKLWRTSVSISKWGDKALARAKEIRRVSIENYFEK